MEVFSISPWWALTFVILIALILRLLPLFFWSFNPSDAWSHIYDAKCIQKKGGIPLTIKGFYPAPQFSYPWLISWIISKYKRAESLTLWSIFNIFLSIVELLLLYIGLQYLLHEIGFSVIENSRTALTSVILLAVNPAIYSPWMKLYGIHARTIGSFNCTLAIFFIYLAVEISVLFYLGYMLCVSFIVFSSKFGLQALVVGTLFMSIFMHDPVAIFIFIMTILLANILSGGKSGRILKGHIYHSIFYKDFLQYKHRGTASNSWTLNYAFTEFIRRHNKGLIQIIYRTPVLRVVIMNPLIALIPALYFSYSTLPEELRVLLNLATSSLLLIPIINIRTIRFLGEADRYFSFFGLVPLSIVAGFYLANISSYFHLFLIMLIVVSILICFLFIKIRAQDKVDADFSSDKKMAECLNNLLQQEYGRILVYPQNMSERVAHFVDGEFAGIHLNATWNIAEWEIYKKLYPSVFPFPSSELSVLRSMNIKYLVIYKRYYDPAYLKKSGLDHLSIVYPNIGEIIFDNNEISLQRIPGY